MRLTVSSDTRVDQEILRALTPKEPTPFEDLIKGAQNTLALMKKSLFFRRFVKENLTHVMFAQVIRIARATSGNSEWLVITDDFQIKFMRITDDDLFFYDYGDREHESFLINKARSRLEAMCGVASCMRFLISRTDKPSFSAEEVQAELTSNGNVTIISIREGHQGSANREDNIQKRLQALQFSTNVLRIGYDDALPEITNGNYIIVLDIAIEQVIRANSCYVRLSPTQQRHLWTTIAGEAPPNFYVEAGYSPEVTSFPGYAHCIHLPDDRLLARLSTMFAVPE